MKAHDGTRITSPPIIVTFQKLFRPLSLALATSAKSGWRDQNALRPIDWRVFPPKLVHADRLVEREPNDYGQQ